MHKKVVFFFFWFVLKNQIFSLLFLVIMDANCAKICRVGKLEEEFQQVTLVLLFFGGVLGVFFVFFFVFFFVCLFVFCFCFFFLKFSKNWCETSIIQNQQRKVKLFS